MTRVLFICHGNICRSPMAEFVLKDMVQQRGCAEAFFIASAATSTEEIGNPVHAGTRTKLRKTGLSCAGKTAVRLTSADYNLYDHLLCMDGNNVRNALCILNIDPQHKLRRLLDFTDAPRDIADPWYSGDFDATYRDVLAGCEAFLASICAADGSRCAHKSTPPHCCHETGSKKA